MNLVPLIFVFFWHIILSEPKEKSDFSIYNNIYDKSNCSFGIKLVESLQLKYLCDHSIEKLFNGSIDSLINYDSSPLLCVQFYFTQLNLCRENNTNRVISDDIFKQNITQFCMIAKTYDETFTDLGEFEKFDDAFKNIIRNKSNCVDFCKKKFDNTVLDLCKIIVLSKPAEKAIADNSTHTERTEQIFKMNNPKDTDFKPVDINTSHFQPVKEVKVEPKSSITDIPKTKENVNLTNNVLNSSRNSTNINVKYVDSKNEVEKSLNNDKKSVSIKPDAFVNDFTVDKSKNEKDNKQIDEQKSIVNDDTDKETPPDEQNNEDFIYPKNDVGDTQIHNDLMEDVENSGPDNFESDDKKTPLSISNEFHGDLDNDNIFHFSTYFYLMSAVLVILFFLVHCKKKILALAVEGRRARAYSGSRRRPHTAAYSKLDSNLEEAMVSDVSQASVTHVLY